MHLQLAVIQILTKRQNAVALKLPQSMYATMQRATSVQKQRESTNAITSRESTNAITSRENTNAITSRERINAIRQKESTNVIMRMVSATSLQRNSVTNAKRLPLKKLLNKAIN